MLKPLNSKLNAKLLEEKLKRGWTSSNFAQYLECTDEDFLDAIKKTFRPKIASRIIARLKQNEKRCQRTSHPVDTDIQFKSENEVISLETELSNKDILENLLKEEEILRQKIIDGELITKEIRKKITLFYKDLRSHKERLLEIKGEVQLHTADIEKIVSELTCLSSKLEKTNLTISGYRHELGRIIEEIASLKKVYIYVYDDGEIEIENAKPVYTGWENKFKEMIDFPEFESLSIKQLKLLAKVVVFIQHLKDQQLEFEITFESKSLQEIYQKLH